MKAVSRSKAVRHGAAWEAQLAALHESYRERGLALIVRSPAPLRVIHGARRGGMVQAVHTAAGPADYVGLVRVDGRAQPVAIEAKSTASDRWPLAALPDHQADFLNGWIHMSGISLVLLRLGPNPRDAWAFHWESLRPLWADARSGKAARGKASIDATACDRLGTRFDLEGGWRTALYGPPAGEDFP